MAERGSEQPIPGRCGAKLRRSDPPRYCKCYPMKGRSRCAMCGGKSKRGVEAANFKHGRYSRYIPARYLEVVRESLADPDLMSVRQDFALAEARNAELLQAIDAASSLESWREAGALLGVLQEALGVIDQPAAGILDKLEDVLVVGSKAANGERHAWRELRNNMRVRARLVEVERRRQEQLGAMMPAEQVMALVGRLAAIITEHVPDPATRQRISDELIAIGDSFETATASPHGAF